MATEGRPGGVQGHSPLLLDRNLLGNGKHVFALLLLFSLQLSSPVVCFVPLQGHV